MTLSTFISALAKRGADEALLRAGSEIQICVEGQWRAQSANLTDAALDEMIARALPLDQETAWRAPSGRASFSAQNYGIEASKQAGAVTVTIKRLVKASGGPLTAQSAGELKNSAFANSTAFALVAQPTPPPTAAPSPVSLPTPPAPIVPASAVPPPIPNVAPEWYYCTLEGIERGPFSLMQMRQFANMMTLTAQTLVWKEGMSQWLPVAQTELGQFLPQNGAPDLYGAPPLSAPLYGNRTRNDSGTSGAVLPDELKGFNWGAFFLPVFWCFAHGLPGWAIGLFILGLVPGINFSVGLVCAFVVGFNGNQMAWENRVWSSHIEFKDVQKAWMWWGFGVFVVISLCVAVAVNS